MVAGRLVFPVIILTFTVFLGVWVNAHPAPDAPRTIMPLVEVGCTALPNMGLQRLSSATSGTASDGVHVGDSVIVEFTDYYDPDHRYAWRTTREELTESEALKSGPFGLWLFPSNLARVDVNPSLNDVLNSFVGRAVNETFNTPLEENHYGAWQERCTLPVSYARFERTVTVTSRDARWTAINGTLRPSEPGQLGRPVAVGDQFYCESYPWLCKIEALDRTRGMAQFTRLVEPEQRMPKSNAFGWPPNGEPRSPLVVHMVDDNHFDLQWEPQPNDVFVVKRQSLFPGGNATLSENWKDGTYYIESTLPSVLTTRYTNHTEAPPAPYGEVAWTEFQIVSIQRP